MFCNETPGSSSQFAHLNLHTFGTGCHSCGFVDRTLHQLLQCLAVRQVRQNFRFVVKHTKTEATAVSPVAVMLLELVNFELLDSHESLLASVADVVFLGTVRQHVPIQT